MEKQHLLSTPGALAGTAPLRSGSALPMSTSRHPRLGMMARLVCKSSLLMQHERLSAAERDAIRRCTARLDHMASIADLPPQSCVEWTRQRLPRLIVDYFLREGHFESARMLSKQCGCDDLCEWHVFQDAADIVRALRAQDCTAALSWCELSDPCVPSHPPCKAGAPAVASGRSTNAPACWTPHPEKDEYLNCRRQLPARHQQSARVLQSCNPLHLSEAPCTAAHVRVHPNN
jgi:hypothetical protein